MSDAEIITLESDDDADGADLIVGPNGTAVPIGEARRQNMGRLPLPPGMRMQMGRAGFPAGNVSSKAPKKPGSFPPFALFSQEHRARLMTENKSIRYGFDQTFLICEIEQIFVENNIVVVRV